MPIPLSYSMADKSMSTSSPFIRGIFFFLFLPKKKNKEHLVKYCSNINRLERDVKAIEVCSPQPQWLTMNGDDGQQTN